MGRVYAADDGQRGERVALKTLSRLDANAVYRLKHEFRALSELRHENLVHLHELFNDGGLWFFTMELVDGVGFDRWVRPGAKLDEDRLRSTFPQLVQAVRVTHHAGKLHRDLKPSNVLVTPSGRVVVLDFGLSIEPAIVDPGPLPAETSVSGTPGYMAPEQAAGQFTSTASDVYALGVMLFEVVVGRLPFEGLPTEILAAKQREDAPRPSACAADVAPDLDDLCARLLARSPEARPTVDTLCRLVAPVPGDRGVALGRVSSDETEFLGRERELEVLRAAFETSAAGRAVVMFVSGESGIGKSALVATLVDELRGRRGATVLTGRCYERENVPYQGFDALIDELSRYLRGLPTAEATTLVPPEVFALSRIFPVLDRVPVVAEAPRKAVPDPQDLKRRAFAALAGLVARMRARVPLVLVIDDLQWIDVDSARLMRALFLHRDPAPVLLVCMYRTERAAQNALLRSVRDAAEDNPALDVRDLSVDALPHHALVALSRRLLPRGIDVRIADHLASEARGSPFFAVELSRALVLDSAVSPSVQRSPTSRPTLSLEEALLRHVGALPKTAQSLLSVLALAGQPLAQRVAVEAAATSEGHALLDLLRREQLVRVSFDGDGERTVECYHDKIREQIRRSLSDLDTRRLASTASTVLLGQPELDDELLSHMLGLAGERRQAAEHAARAAETALASLAFERAATLFSRAVADGTFSGARLATLRVRRAEALAHAGHGARAAEAFVDAARHAESDAVDALKRRAGEQYFMCGDVEQGRALMAESLRPLGIRFARTLVGAVGHLVWSRLRLRIRRPAYVPREIHDHQTLRNLAALESLTQSLVRSDQLRAADFWARWTFHALRAGHGPSVGRALSWGLLFQLSLGASEPQLQELAAQSERIGRETGDWLTEFYRCYALGIYHHSRLHRTVEALAYFDRQLVLLEDHPYVTASYDRAWIQYWRSSCLLFNCRCAESHELALHQLEGAIARGDHTASVALTLVAALSSVALDRPEQAARLLENASKPLRSGEIRLQHMFLLMGLAVPKLYEGDPCEAWRLVHPQLRRYESSFQGRVLNNGIIDQILCGVAAAASTRTGSRHDRLQLERAARRMAKRGLLTPLRWGEPGVVLACLQGDREGAISTLRARMRDTVAPIYALFLQRRLGELLADDEGHRLIAEADAALRAGGVVHPDRVVAARLPGVELRT